MFSKPALDALAGRFLDATLYKVGTDEAAAYQILQSVREQKSSFEKTITTQSGRTVASLLRGELSSSEMAYAEDLYQGRSEQYRADKFDYFLEGLTTCIDLSSTQSKAVLVAGFGLFGIAALISVPFAVCTSAVLGFATGVYGVGKVVKNTVEFFKSQTEKEKKMNLRDLGEGTGVLLLTSPALWKSTQIVQNMGSKIFEFGWALFTTSEGATMWVSTGSYILTDVETLGTAIDMGLPTVMAAVAVKLPKGNLAATTEADLSSLPDQAEVAFRKGDRDTLKAIYGWLAKVKKSVSESSIKETAERLRTTIRHYLSALGED